VEYDGDLTEEHINLTHQMATAKAMQGLKSLPNNFFITMRDLEQILTRATERDNFVPEEIRNREEKEKYLEGLKKVMNLNEDPEKWFERSLLKYLETLFEMRKEVEKNISKGELQLFDIGFKQLLQP